MLDMVRSGLANFLFKFTKSLKYGTRAHGMGRGLKRDSSIFSKNVFFAIEYCTYAKNKKNIGNNLLPKDFLPYYQA
jgi:hypothetical protein